MPVLALEVHTQLDQVVGEQEQVGENTDGLLDALSCKTNQSILLLRVEHFCTESDQNRRQQQLLICGSAMDVSHPAKLRQTHPLVYHQKHTKFEPGETSHMKDFWRKSCTVSHAILTRDPHEFEPTLMCSDITNTLVGISGETVPEGGNLCIY